VEFRGIRALVTGASSGIGRALALELARRGSRLVLTGRSEEALREVAEESRRLWGEEAEVLALDLLEPEAPRRLYEATEGAGKAVDLLVNNAGMGTFGLFGQIPLEKELALVRLNVVVLMELTHRFLPRMVDRGVGGILNVASTASFAPTPHMAVYGASKAFVLSFTEAVSAEVRGTGVRVMALCPGPTKTDFQRRAGIPVRKPEVRFEDPELVARRALKALARGRTTVVSGRLNFLQTLVPRVLPRRLVALATERLLRPQGFQGWRRSR
jgi:hypothetical protein